jgi:hypothetical protein
MRFSERLRRTAPLSRRLITARRLVPFVALVLVALTSCAQILGLDEFTEGQTSGGASSVNTGSGSTSTSSSAMGGSGGGTFCKAGETVACYTGAKGTEGAGTCKGGSKLCFSDGSKFGDCMNEVTPAMADDCVAMKDANCNGTLECMCTPGSAMACYDGGDGTENVGACVGGMRTCDDKGLGFGPCVGQVTPKTIDDCTTPDDDNCDGEINDLCTCTPLATQSCYDGDPNTKGVGNCVPGSQTCNMAGNAWSSCQGEVVPLAENCAIKGDEDCNGTACADAVWAEPFPATLVNAYATVDGQVIDKNGNIFLTGVYVGTIDFGNGVTLSLTGGHTSELYLVKLDPSGKALWAKAIGSSKGYTSTPVAVAVNFNGYVFIGGSLNGTMNFDGTPLTPTGNVDIFIASYDAAGAYRWASRFGSGGTNTDQVYQLACNSSGHVIASGAFTGTLVMGGSFPSTGSSDIFVSEIADSNGSAIWTKTFGDVPAKPADSQLPNGLAVDSGDNILLTAGFASNMELAGSFTSVGGTDILVAKLDKTGTPLWAQAFGSPGFEGTGALAVDSAGAVIVTGTVKSTINFGGGNLSGGDDDMFLVKLNGANGNHLWSKRFPASGVDSGESLAVDSLDNILFAGRTHGNIDFGNGSLVAAGKADVTFAKFDPSGVAVWSKLFGDATDQYFTRVSVKPGTNHPVLSLSTEGSIDFGTGLLSAGPNSNAVMTAEFQP